MIAGICPHGIMMAGLDESMADEDEMREFAAAYQLERREELRFEGHCIPCQERYRTNCALLGIEP